MEHLTHPIGKFTRPTGFDEADVSAWMETIRHAPLVLRSLVSKLSPEQLAKSYRPDGWSILSIVHHLADMHMNAFLRCKLALAEENPTVMAVPEKSFATQADALTGVEDSLRILEGVHARCSVLFQSLTREQWDRGFVHPANQRVMTLHFTLAMYAWHAQHHIEHIKLAIAEPC
ncbi:MAG: YfiT family bacillithiol transferase [Candidatus Kapaibacterium sp.]